MPMLNLKFKCYWENETWEGNIKSAREYGSHYYIEISAKDSGISVYFGRGFGCWFVCIPDWQAGVRIGTLDNIGYNAEKIGATMKNEIDGISVASAIAAYAKHLDIKEHDDTQEVFAILKEAGFTEREKKEY